MPPPEVRFLNAGDTALVIEFGDRIDRALSERVLDLKVALHGKAIAGVIETVATFRSLLVHYDPLRITCAKLADGIRELLQQRHRERASARLWRIPACYEGDHAPDLAEVAKRTGLAEAEVVRLHASVRYHVYMIGFVPGYPYLGDLPEPLRLSRRNDPRVRVPPGSVAIAAGMTAIYPVESPGGWHLIGNTPVPLFDSAAGRPALLSPGDSVRFEPVSSSEHDRLRRRINAGDWETPSESHPATSPA